MEHIAHIFLALAYAQEHMANVFLQFTQTGNQYDCVLLP